MVKNDGNTLVLQDGIGGHLEVMGSLWRGAILYTKKIDTPLAMLGVPGEHSVVLDGSDALHLALHLVEAQCEVGSSAHPEQRAVLEAVVATLRIAMRPKWLNFLDDVGLELSESCHSVEEQNEVRRQHGLEPVAEDEEV